MGSERCLRQTSLLLVCCILHDFDGAAADIRILAACAAPSTRQIAAASALATACGFRALFSILRLNPPADITV